MDADARAWRRVFERGKWLVSAVESSADTKIVLPVLGASPLAGLVEVFFDYRVREHGAGVGAR
jgi:hypothetical protein